LKKRATENFITVTELADSIVRKENLPFRISHKIVGQCVKTAYEAKSEITYEMLQKISKEIVGRELNFTEDEFINTLTAEYFVSIRTIYGGSAPSETKRALSVEREFQTQDETWLTEKNNSLKNAQENLRKQIEQILA
jgi:argininosuccinate lyase